MLIADLLCVRKGWYLIILILSIILCACTDKPTKTFQGYVEGEFVYVGSPIGGRLEELKIQRGQPVAKGDLLFRLEDDLEKAVVQEASKKYRQAMDSLANLRKGKRPSEVQAIEARLNRASPSFPI